ncbi:TonB-dependent receptor [Roseateles paludis]|uniref:TonB-dependent receptor n=1 Tax=Roseateles paludis TaxID=3145238 RepID=A0ABV0G4C5_9BURK
MFPSRFAHGAIVRACLLLGSVPLFNPAALACDDCDPELHASAASDASASTPQRLAPVQVDGLAPSSLPATLPTTHESLTRAEMERSINATDSEDALKYFPSLLVRKRYIGDYNHAILSSRASGTGNSARSAVYADGILLSNYLGNGVGGLSFPPRWGMVTPEEIERVDVIYGPFSAAYPGNAVGAVVDYVTRMPTKFEAHAKLSLTTQPFELYNTRATYRAWQASAAVGSREGAFSWWLGVNRTDSDGQPLTFATRLVSSGTAVTTGTPVTGAVLGLNNANQPWYLIGAATQYRTQQDHIKLKLAYDLSPQLRATYLFGTWLNAADGNSQSYLTGASGQAVTSGAIVIDGKQYAALTGADFSLTREKLRHAMHGLTLKSRTGGEWDWELAASLYDYARDDKRQNAANNPQPGAWTGGAGTLADGSGTGWNTLSARTIWRPAGARHVVDLGLQQDSYALRYRTSNITGNYLVDDPGSLASNVQGHTRTQAAFVQDAWGLSEDWKLVLGLRAEHWRASEGRTEFSASSRIDHAARTENYLSPKAALSWQASNETLLKASVGRAVRLPTVAELYGATSTTNSQYINDPGLKPEKSWTAEWSAEQVWGDANNPLQSRITLFAESTRDAIYSQTLFDAAANRNISRVQNVDRIGTTGIETSVGANDFGLKGLDVSASVTYADSKIKRNAGFVAAAGDTVGKWQPNVARWRGTLQASYRFNAAWTASLAARYSGRQFRTLNNADVNGYAYQGVSAFKTLDARMLWRIDPRWTAALGVDNLNNNRYWNFHPYPQRSVSAELKVDL